MLVFLVVVLLAQYAIGGVVPEYYNTNASALSGADCEINPFGGGLPTPLLLRGVNFAYPTASGQTTLQFTAGETIDLACPGGRLVLEGVTTTLQVATATCVSGVRFIVNNARYLWWQIQCSVDPVSTARFTGNGCQANGHEAEVGFEITSTRFTRTIQVCFDVATQSPIWTYYDLIPAINQQIRGTPRPSWTQLPSNFFTISNVNSLYTQAVQRVTINNLLELPTGSFQYVQNNNNFFLSRGHLVARSDFFYAAQQNSTFHFSNANPQWQTFNGFNWDTAETNVQDYAAANNVHLQVWTGGWGVTTLPHSVTGVETPLYLSVNGNQRAIPVPEIYWKVVYNPVSQRGVAIIGVNNPYKTSAQIDRFCEDRSFLLPWLTWDQDNQQRGISWACTVTAFRRIVNNFPDIEIRGLLF